MDFLEIKNSLDNLTFLILLVSVVFYWLTIAFSKTFGPLRIGYYSVCLANIFITIILGSRWLENGYFPLSNLYESLLFFSWGITAITIFVEYKTKLILVGAVATPLVMFVTAFATLSLPEGMQKAAPLVPALKSNWLMMHVSIMMLSYSTLIIGSLLSILFLVLTKGKDVKIQGNSLGSKEYSNFENQTNEGGLRDVSIGVLTISGSETSAVDKVLPNPQRLTLLESVDNLSYRIIGFGFPLLTIGIVAGAVWANEAWGSYWSWDPKETWALITWIVFASYLHARLTKGWEGQKTALLGSLGFFVIWVCYLGVNFLGKGLHSYGWLS